jgi:radial spoke head protein 4A
MEEAGTGVNKLSYWVTSSTVGEWKKLPDLAPKDIKASRAVKVLFSGNPKRDIFTNPYFFGKEEHYLRA